MSAAEPPPEAIIPPEELDSISAAFRGYIERLKAGDVGSLPVILGMVVIVIFFTIKSPVFFSSLNFNNLIVQLAGTTVVAIGVVFVLLLGEIDLSIGYVSGVAGVTVAWLQQPGTDHQVPGIVAIIIAIAVGALIGVFQGSFVAFIGVPSFVVTLAGLLAWQGVIIRWIGEQGVIGVQDNLINDVANYVLPVWLAILVALLIVSESRPVPRRASTRATARASRCAASRLRRCASCSWSSSCSASSSSRTTDARAACRSPVCWSSRCSRCGRSSRGAPRSAGTSTRSAAAPRPRTARASTCSFIRVSVFAISSGMAAIGGIIFASRLNSVDLNAGGGTILLDAIAAAVIGGTSLFGGRGRVISALLGALVISTIGNGLSLIGSAAATQYIATGVILLGAVVLDTVSRRRLAASGR